MSLVVLSGGQRDGCQINNAKSERIVNSSSLPQLERRSGRRPDGKAAARSHRKSPENAMCSQPTGDVWASSSLGTRSPCARRCPTASAMYVEFQ
jgi:hypothetical protein